MTSNALLTAFVTENYCQWVWMLHF